MAIPILKAGLRATVDEIAYVKEAERKAAMEASVMRLKLSLMDAKYSDPQIKRIMKRAKANLFGFGETKERRHARPDPEWIAQAEERRWGLNHRRRVELRRKARWQNLAYGFLRGVPYKAMERIAYEPPPWHLSVRRLNRFNKGYLELRDHVLDLVIRSSGDIPEQTIRQRYAEWLDGAGKWRHPDAVVHPVSSLGRKTEIR